jgi:hypothetical protein
MSTTEIYRVLFETVHTSALRKYCNADPVMFRNTTQTVPNSQIPDEDWHPVEGRATDSPWQQYKPAPPVGDRGSRVHPERPAAEDDV